MATNQYEEIEYTETTNGLKAMESMEDKQTTERVGADHSPNKQKDKAKYENRYDDDGDGDTERRHFSSIPGIQQYGTATKTSLKAGDDSSRPSYLDENSELALQIRNKAVDYDEENKDLFNVDDSQMMPTNGALLESPDARGAAYVEQTRLHTDTNEDGWMVEEDLGLEEATGGRRMSAASGFGNHQRMMSGSIKASLPLLKINVPLSLSTHDVFDVFTLVSAKEKFQIIELEQTIATAVNKEPFSLRKMFLKCMPFADGGRAMTGNSPISAVRLQILINDVKGCRKIILKGLYGDSELLKTFIAQFRQRLQLLVKKEGGGAEGGKGQKRGAGRKRGGTSATTTQQTMHDDDSDDDHELRVGKYTETSSVYQINKILSTDQYAVGRNVQQYLDSFQIQYKSVAESAALLPQPIEGIMNVVNETVQSFNSEYNLGKEMGKDMLFYCRGTVEKYIFTKLYDQLIAMYAHRNEADDTLFTQRSFRIKQMKPAKVMEYLGINEKFIIQSKSRRWGTLGSLSEASIDETPDSARSQSNDDRSKVSYIEAIREIEKIEQLSAPGDMVNCLSVSFEKLKTAVVDHHKGKLELSAMDDVLPLSIYCVSMANLAMPASHQQMMADYLRCNQRGYELERKLLCNFDGAVRYVCNDWELDDQ